MKKKMTIGDLSYTDENIPLTLSYVRFIMRNNFNIISINNDFK